VALKCQTNVLRRAIEYLLTIFHYRTRGNSTTSKTRFAAELTCKTTMYVNFKEDIMHTFFSHFTAVVESRLCHRCNPPPPYLCPCNSPLFNVSGKQILGLDNNTITILQNSVVETRTVYANWRTNLEADSQLSLTCKITGLI
jgi:hypothetical protein